MNIEDMTADELRAYAEAKDAGKQSLKDLYISEGVSLRPVEPKREVHEPWEQPVEFEGETYYVDIRRTKSLKFIRAFSKLQKSQKESVDGNPDLDAVIDLMDMLFGGSVNDAVVANVSAAMGYDDFEEIYRIESGIMEHLDLKN